MHTQDGACLNLITIHFNVNLVITKGLRKGNDSAPLVQLPSPNILEK